MSDERPPRDHTEHGIDGDEQDETATEPGIAEHVRSKSTWLRLLFMVVMVLLYAISRIVVAAVVLIQFFYVLFTGAAHEPLIRFGQSLATYSYQIILYLTYNSEIRPFPFDAGWPEGAPDAVAADDDRISV